MGEGDVASRNGPASRNDRAMMNLRALTIIITCTDPFLLLVERFFFRMYLPVSFKWINFVEQLFV